MVGDPNPVATPQAVQGVVLVSVGEDRRVSVSWTVPLPLDSTRTIRPCGDGDFLRSGLSFLHPVLGSSLGVVPCVPSPYLFSFC